MIQKKKIQAFKKIYYDKKKSVQQKEISEQPNNKYYTSENKVSLKS